MVQCFRCWSFGGGAEAFYNEEGGVNVACEYKSLFMPEDLVERAVPHLLNLGCGVGLDRIPDDEPSSRLVRSDMPDAEPVIA